MNVSCRITFLVFFCCAFALAFLFPHTSLAQASENQQIVVEGSLTDASGNPIDLSTASLTFYVMTNSSCYLYGESSAGAGDSSGNISHRLGSGSVVSGSPNTFNSNLFFGSSSGTTTFAGNNCFVTAADVRLVQVYYPAQNITANLKLGTVPYAHNAIMLNGKSAADFLQVTAESNTLFYNGSAGEFLSRSASGTFVWVTPSITAAQVTTALGYTPSSGSASVTSSSITAALGYTPADSTALASYTQRTNNLSDLTNIAAARTNLGLGSFATASSVDLSSASATGVIAEARLANISGITSGSQYTKITVDGKGRVISGSTLATSDITTSLGYTPANSSTLSNYALRASNLSDMTNSATARTNLGLGNLATKNSVDITTAEVTGNLPVAKLPAFSGDITTSAGTSTTLLQSIRGIAVAATAPVSGQIFLYNGTAWTPTSVPANPGTVTNIFTGTGLSGGPITTSGTISVAFGTSAGTVAAGNDSRITGALQASNNLSDITSATQARNNLGLSGLATKSTISLTTDVSGILPSANGGSKWTSHVNGAYHLNNISIGSSTVLTNTKLLVENSSPSQIARFINTSATGYGVRIDVNNADSNYYGLNVNANGNSLFMVQNDGKIGVGTLTPDARLHLPAGTASVAPLKFTTGNLTTSAGAGALEYDGSRLYLTDSSNNRRALAMGSNGSSIDNITHINSSSDINLVTTSGTARITGRLEVNNSFGGEGFLLNTAGSSVHSTFALNGTANGFIGTGHSTALFSSGGITNGMFVRATNGLQLGVGSNPNLTINNLGNVGIGITNPNTKFHVQSTSGEIARFEGPTGGYLILSASGTNRGLLGYGSGAGTLFLNELTNSFGIRGESALQLGVATTAQITVTSGGNVGIGLTNPSYKLDVNGDLRISGTPYRAGGDTSWAIPSDQRLKDIKSSYSRGLREIASLDTYIYNYKPGNPKQIDSSKEYTGVMAQQVQKQIPEAVFNDKEGFLGLNTTPIFWAMVNAIKELYHNSLDTQADLAAKEQKIQKLEADNAAKAQEIQDMKARLERLEQSLNAK